MATVLEDLLQYSEQLRKVCAMPVGNAGTYEQICILTRRIADLSGAPEVRAGVLEVRFKAEDLFSRMHLVSESILRMMLEDRLQRLDALLRARLSPPRDRRAPGQRGRRASDREPQLSG